MHAPANKRQIILAMIVISKNSSRAINIGIDYCEVAAIRLIYMPTTNWLNHSG
jgi:hypothetical protein